MYESYTEKMIKRMENCEVSEILFNRERINHTIVLGKYSNSYIKQVIESYQGPLLWITTSCTPDICSLGEKPIYIRRMEDVEKIHDYMKLGKKVVVKDTCGFIVMNEQHPEWLGAMHKALQECMNIPDFMFVLEDPRITYGITHCVELLLRHPYPKMIMSFSSFTELNDTILTMYPGQKLSALNVYWTFIVTALPGYDKELLQQNDITDEEIYNICLPY